MFVGSYSMNKPFVVLIAAGTALASVGIGIVAARANRKVAAWAYPHARPRANATAPSESAAASSDKSMVIRFAKDPQPVPPFLLLDLDGNPVSTAAWQGKVVLVNFWATWCPPCRDEIPILIQLYEKYKNDLLIIGISVDDGSPNEVRDFAHSVGINYPIVMRSRELLAEYGGVPALPTSFLVNKEGRVVQKHEGLFSPVLYETEVRALIGLPVDATITTFEDTGQIFLKNAERATELPGLDFSKLTADQKKLALKRLNTQICDCGCRLTLAQCRINDTSCPVSKGLAEKIVKEILAATPEPRAGSGSAPPRTDR
jgi:thiol-disulfide isomerase/thioredoxin